MKVVEVSVISQGRMILPTAAVIIVLKLYIL